MAAPGQQRIERRLAADVVGYSRLMGADEAGTAKALREHRAAIDRIVASHGGSIVKTTGTACCWSSRPSLPRPSVQWRFKKLMAERN
jgi:hypothetical protein